MACLLAACGSASTAPSPSSGIVRTVDLRDADGNSVGTATLTAVPVTPFSPDSATASPGAPATSGIRFHVVVTSLAPGSHGFHVHAAGRCDPPRFTSAGAHFNPTHRRHGLAARAGPHAGDLPNLPVGADGRATVDFVSATMTLEPDHDNSVSGPAGTSLVIHARVDDEVSDPAGNSGDRIACGVISPATAGASAEAEPTPSAPPSVRATATPRPVATSTPTPAAPSASPSFGHGTGLEGVGTPLPSP